jgi:hypothetical protein
LVPPPGAGAVAQIFWSHGSGIVVLVVLVVDVVDVVDVDVDVVVGGGVPAAACTMLSITGAAHTMPPAAAARLMSLRRPMFSAVMPTPQAPRANPQLVADALTL